jgi:GTPase
VALGPIFQVSNVTGENLDLVRTFLNILLVVNLPLGAIEPAASEREMRTRKLTSLATRPHHGRYDADAPFEFSINDTFSVPFVGTVVSGIIKSGVMHVGDNVWIGPDSNGGFSATNVRSIQRKRLDVPAASAGQSASFALRKVRRKEVRKGMVLLPKIEGQPAPKVSREFVAEVLILSHATTIKAKYQASKCPPNSSIKIIHQPFSVLHVGPVAQTCAIIDIDRPFIRTGDRATVAFRFTARPEYIVEGDKLLFREGRTKGLGIVKSVGYDPSQPLMEQTSTDQRDGENKASAEVQVGA